jgi:hypothetical protein
VRDGGIQIQRRENECGFIYIPTERLNHLWIEHCDGWEGKGCTVKVNGVKAAHEGSTVDEVENNRKCRH